MLKGQISKIHPQTRNSPTLEAGRSEWQVLKKRGLEIRSLTNYQVENRGETRTRNGGPRDALLRYNVILKEKLTHRQKFPIDKSQKEIFKEILKTGYDRPKPVKISVFLIPYLTFMYNLQYFSSPHAWCQKRQDYAGQLSENGTMILTPENVIHLHGVRIINIHSNNLRGWFGLICLEALKVLSYWILSNKLKIISLHKGIKISICKTFQKCTKMVFSCCHCIFEIIIWPKKNNFRFYLWLLNF